MTRRGLYSRPEAFSLSPFLALVPSAEPSAPPEAVTSSLYARYEKVTLLKKEGDREEAGRADYKRLLAEELMLREVLDWLAVRPGDAEGAADDD